MSGRAEPLKVGCKLLMVPDCMIADRREDDPPGMAWVLDGIRNLTSNGPFKVVGEVGEDRALRMSRPLYDTIEVVDGP